MHKFKRKKKDDTSKGKGKVLPTFNNHVENLFFKCKNNIKRTIKSVILPTLRRHFHTQIPLKHWQNTITLVPNQGKTNKTRNRINFNSQQNTEQLLNFKSGF